MVRLYLPKYQQIEMVFKAKQENNCVQHIQPKISACLSRQKLFKFFNHHSTEKIPKHHLKKPLLNDVDLFVHKRKGQKEEFAVCEKVGLLTDLFKLNFLFRNLY